MSSLPEPIERAAASFDRLPGLGPRAALRYVSWLATQPKESILAFARAIEALANAVRHCSVCQQWTDQHICRICRDTNRDTYLLCVVATSQDIRPIEDSGAFKGRYHVLQGTLDPLEGRGAEHLTIRELRQRLATSKEIQEVLLALDADVSGDATALFLQQELQAFPHVKVTRLARGLPSGATLEYADPLTLIDAINNRKGQTPTHPKE